MSHGKFATVINCMDGRTQEPVIEYIKAHHGVDFVDSVTEAGPVRALAENEGIVETIKSRVRISVEKHGSRSISIVAHHDCAGNPVDEETQKEQLKKAVSNVESMGFDAVVEALWVGSDWKVSECAKPGSD